MKKLFNTALIALGLMSGTSQAALEIVSITFHKNEWFSEFGKSWHYSEVGDTVLDLKALMNDRHNGNADTRSYILEYNIREFLGGFSTVDWEGHIDFSQATLTAVEVRTRGLQDGFEVSKGDFALQVGGTVGPVKAGPNPSFDFGPGFRSVVVPIPQGNMSGDWKLVVNGKVEINQIIMNIVTDNDSCLRNLCGL